MTPTSVALFRAVELLAALGSRHEEDSFLLVKLVLPAVDHEDFAGLEDHSKAGAVRGSLRLGQQDALPFPGCLLPVQVIAHVESLSEVIGTTHEARQVLHGSLLLLVFSNYAPATGQLVLNHAERI